jgi:pSer/pThr/pTyr-binding forkhead associated (FHA) protein
MATLVVVSGNAGAASFAVDQGVTLGRGAHNSIPLPEARGISRDHAKVWRLSPAKYAVADLGSTNGVLHNNQKTPRSELTDGDEIQIGDIVLRFELDDDEKPKPKMTAAREDGRDDFASILRGDKERTERPVATQVEGHAAIQMKQRILQYNKKSASENKLSWDISQTGGLTGVFLKLGAVAIVAVLFYVALKMFGGD